MQLHLWMQRRYLEKPGEADLANANLTSSLNLSVLTQTAKSLEICQAPSLFILGVYNYTNSMHSGDATVPDISQRHPFQNCCPFGKWKMKLGMLSLFQTVCVAS